MRKLIMFNMVSLDGFFEGPGHDITWHTVDEEFNEFAIEQVDSVDAIMFGRITYELMVSYWPTSEALKDDPAVAELMNTKPKVVVSGSMSGASWNNTRIISRDVDSEIRRLKELPGKDLIIFGSATLCSSLVKSKLIDEFRIMISPTLLIKGTPLFRDRIAIKLKESRRFGNGNVLLTYSP